MGYTTGMNRDDDADSGTRRFMGQQEKEMVDARTIAIGKDGLIHIVLGWLLHRAVVYLFVASNPPCLNSFMAKHHRSLSHIHTGASNT